MIQEKKRGLGRGLESLIPAARGSAPAAAVVTAEAEPGERVQEIALEEIARSPYQPRRHRQDEAALEELAQSIRAQGVLQPIVLRYIPEAARGRWTGGEIPHPVSPTPGETRAGQPAPDGELSGHPHPISPNPGEIRAGLPASGDEAHAGASAPQGRIKYQLIAGERRWLASKRAGRKTVPAVVRQVSNEQAMEIALIENLQREDLDCLEMAYAFERLSREFHLTQEEMAKRTGKDRTTISNLLRLLKLPPDVRTSLASRALSFGHAKELMELEDATVMSAAAQRVLREGMSVRQTEELVNHLVWLSGNPEPKRERRQVVEDANVRAARMELEGRLGCRVRIMDKNGKGKIVIEYKGLDDFDRIVEALGK